MDDPSIINDDGSWSKERYDEIVTKLTPFLRSCGYNPKKDIVFLPMSGLLGHNIKDPAPKSSCSWYKVRSLGVHFMIPIIDIKYMLRAVCCRHNDKDLSHRDVPYMLFNAAMKS